MMPFFGIATKEKCRVMMSCIIEYCQSSGPLINFGKSSVLFSRNVMPEVQSGLDDSMQVNLV